MANPSAPTSAILHQACAQQWKLLCGAFSVGSGSQMHVLAMGMKAGIRKALALVLAEEATVA